MAYTLPTTDEFIARFPQFATTDEDLLASIIADEATLIVDESWLESNYKQAIMFLVAHWLTVEQNADRPGVISGESFGPISTQYAVNTNTDTLAATQYGVRFMKMRKGNFPAVMVV